VDRHFARLVALAERVDVLFSNEDEAKAMTGTSSAEEAVAKLHRAGRVTVVTMGAAGARITSDEGVVSVAAFPVTEVVDTTGAGDLFAAGVCFGLSHNLGIETAGKLGALCAAEAIGHLGARPATSLATLAKNAGLL
jgi:sugar/nucleoside kinase (ribokinase family)